MGLSHSKFRYTEPQQIRRWCFLRWERVASRNVTLRFWMLWLNPVAWLLRRISSASLHRFPGKRN